MAGMLPHNPYSYKNRKIATMFAIPFAILLPILLSSSVAI